MDIYEAVKSQKKLLESSKHFYEHVKIMKTLRGLYIDFNVRLIIYYLIFNRYHFKLFKRNLLIFQVTKLVIIHANLKTIFSTICRSFESLDLKIFYFLYPT